MIPIYKPYLSKYKDTAIKAINDEWISNHGIYVELASEKLKNILGINHCILMNNGTSATHCILLALKYKYPNINKIYVPNNVFIAPINCAINVFKADEIEVMKVDPNTLNIDVSEGYINTLEQGSAVLIVHNLGNIINVPRLKCMRPDIVFIEDNCEGIFGKYDGKYSGSASLCSALSFYGNKTITTGEGGAFLTNDTDIYKYILKLYSHGMTNNKYIHDIIGYNYRITNVGAGFLYDQLLDIENILILKKNIFDNYNKLIKSHFDVFDGLLQDICNEENTECSRWMYCMILNGINYTDLEQYLLEHGISIRPLFYDIRKHKHLQNLLINYEEEKIFTQGFMLPSYPELTFEQQEYIINTLIKYITIL